MSAPPNGDEVSAAIEEIIAEWGYVAPRSLAIRLLITDDEALWLLDDCVKRDQLLRSEWKFGSAIASRIYRKP